MTQSISVPPTRSTRTTIIAAVGLIAAILYMLPVTDNIPWLSVVLKPIPVLCMALWLAVQPKKGRYQLLVIAGLILGAAGDVLLELEGLFIVGLLSFLLGHVAYILAFLQDSRKLFAGKALIAYAYGAIMFAVLFTAGELGAMTIPVAAYVLVICTMLWRGLSRLGVPGIKPRSAQAGAIGSVLFTISDTVLAFTMFVAPIPLSSWIIMLTYWWGQFGVALSAKEQ